MKTAAFGMSGLAIVMFTVLAVLQISTGHTRTINLQDNLQQVLEASLETAMDNGKSYTIATNDELIADVLEGIAMRLDDNCELRLEVNEVDKTLGILSVKATVYYMTRNQDVNGDGVIDESDHFADSIDWNGDGVIDMNDDLNGDGVLDEKDSLISVVTAERTIILEQYDVALAGKHTIQYRMVDGAGTEALYKLYTLTEGEKVMAPKNPTANFDGHWYLGTTPYTPDQIRNMDLDQDYIFYNKAMP